jgi:hypothetical protein
VSGTDADGVADAMIEAGKGGSWILRDSSRFERINRLPIGDIE